MKNTIRKITRAAQVVLVVLGLGLGAVTAGAVFLPADEASAHQYDNYALLYCSAHQSDYGNHIWVNHSWPYSLEPGILYYKCTQYDTTVFGNPQHQYFVGRNMNTGAHWRQGGYQWCGLVLCTYH